MEGKKESEGKLFYELDWSFIEGMAERMQQNKGDKYPRWNWKKPIEVEGLKQAMFRHVMEVMKGVYEDDGRVVGHLESIALNAMMIAHQLEGADLYRSLLSENLINAKVRYDKVSK